MYKELINNVLEYENQNVIDKFCEKFTIEENSAKIIFQDMLVWLSINHINTLNLKKVELYIDSDLKIIDEMWHCFILHTIDYEFFCQKYFNRFIHHRPTTKQEKLIIIERNNKIFIDEFKNEKTQTYSFIYDLIGKDTFLRWFYEYPLKYKNI